MQSDEHALVTQDAWMAKAIEKSQQHLLPNSKRTCRESDQSPRNWQTGHSEPFQQDTQSVCRVSRQAPYPQVRKINYKTDKDLLLRCLLPAQLKCAFCVLVHLLPPAQTAPNSLRARSHLAWDVINSASFDHQKLCSWPLVGHIWSALQTKACDRVSGLQS